MEKLNSLKRCVRTTLVDTTKTSKIKKMVLPSLNINVKKLKRIYLHPFPIYFRWDKILKVGHATPFIIFVQN